MSVPAPKYSRVRSRVTPPAPSTGVTITILNRQRTKSVDRRRLGQMAAALLADLEVATAEIGIHLVGAKEMARVNWRFLQHEGSTDVITFDHNESADRQATGRPLNGELFVCVDDAVAQAREFGTSWQSEVTRYIVHGILNLLGYDDLQPRRRQIMKREENRWLRVLARKFSLAQIAQRPKIST